MKNIKINGLYFKKNEADISHGDLDLLIREITRVIHRQGFEFFGSFNRVGIKEANLQDPGESTELSPS